VTNTALSLVPQIQKELEAIKKTENAHGQLCAEALDHAIEAGKLLNTAKETVTSEVVNGKKAKWLPWLQTYLGMPQTTASLYMRLATNEEFLFGHKQRVATERLSIRQAAALLPKDEKAKKQAATAEKKRAEKAAEKEAAAIKSARASVSPEEIVENLDVDEIFQVLTTTLNDDQLLELSNRLSSYLEEEEEETEQAESVAVSTLDRLKERYQDRRA